MKIEELVKTVMAENSKLFKGISEKRINRITRSIIVSFAKELDNMPEGKISLQRLGVFKKKIIEKTCQSMITCLI